MNDIGEHKTSVEISVTQFSLVEFSTGIHSVDMRNVSIQRCDIHSHKQDFQWNCLIACEFVDEFCCVFDVAWSELHQALENGIDET